MSTLSRPAVGGKGPPARVLPDDLGDASPEPGAPADTAVAAGADEVKNPERGKSFRRAYEALGVVFAAPIGSQLRADACPFCGMGKFFVDDATGLFVCHSANTCGASGNYLTFLRRRYTELLGDTTDDHLRPLKDRRGLSLQLLKKHGVFRSPDGWYGLPARNPAGEVVNVQRYDLETGDKRFLPALALPLFGLDRLTADPVERAKRTLLLTEGPFDLMAVDQQLTASKTRTRFDLLAPPSATVFKPEWADRLKGYGAVRLCFDNDKAGRDGQDRVAKVVAGRNVGVALHVLRWPADAPDKCDLGDLVRDGVSVARFTQENSVPVTATGPRLLFTRGDRIPEQRIEWLWDRRIPFGKMASLSGVMGTGKSLIAKALAAHHTAGRPMPGCLAGAPPGDVLYFTSEDSAADVRDLVSLHGGDLTRLHVHDIAAADEPADLLECLPEMEAAIHRHGARLVVLDALNSFVGGDISTDAKARRTLSGRLQGLARRTGACVLGIRNWGRAEGGTAMQKVMGAQSLSDVARCVMNTYELKAAEDETTPPRRFELQWEKLSGAPQPAAVRYAIKDESRGAADKSHLRRVVFARPAGEELAAFKAHMAAKMRSGKG